MPATVLRVASPSSRPLLVWDGDCHFCAGWIRRWQAKTGNAVDYIPYQKLGGRFPELPKSASQQAVHLILPDGTVLTGALAVFTALSIGRDPSWCLRWYRQSALFAWLAETVYRLVSHNRTFLSWLTRRLWKNFETP